MMQANQSHQYGAHQYGAHQYGAHQSGYPQEVTHRPALTVQPAQHRPATTGIAHDERHYSLVAMAVPDGSGREQPLLALRRHLPLLEALRAAAKGRDAHLAEVVAAGALDAEVRRLAQACGLTEQKVRPLLSSGGAEGETATVQPSVRPLVLRASLGERLETQVTNLLHTPLCIALVDDDYAIQQAGSDEPLAAGETRTYVWHCRHTGIYPMYNRLSADAVERRCLLGVLIIEP